MNRSAFHCWFKPVIYRLNSRRGCTYLRGLLRLKEILWTEEDLGPFDDHGGKAALDAAKKALGSAEYDVGEV